MKIKARKVIKSDYYDNPDRIVIGVDITTHLDMFEENWSEYTGGKDFDWNQDRNLFDNMLSDIEYQIAENFYKKLGHAPVEEFHDGFGDSFSTYSLTYWGDRNSPEDIAALESLQGQADDSWTDQGKLNLAIYDSEVYAGNVNSFLDKWGDKGTEYGVMAEALVDAITVGIDFPEEFDSDPMYDRVGGMSVRK